MAGSGKDKCIGIMLLQNQIKACPNYSMIFEFEHPLLGLYLTPEQNFDY